MKTRILLVTIVLPRNGRGVRLSGGQRQRLGLASTLYHHPSLLVLDDATSALDTATEGRLVEALARLARRFLVVIVAHRLTTMERCEGVFDLSRPIGTRTGPAEQIVSVRRP